jgi:Glycine zipper 2TM domain
MMTRIKPFSRAAFAAMAASALVLLAGCVEAPPRRAYAPPPPDKPNTDVYAYPTKGQTPDQQERDRYECNAWAVKQSGFDPSGPNVPPHDRYRVVSAGPPPGTGTAVGAFTGAILGAAVSRPRDAGAGMLLGAVAGGLIGNASDQAREQQTQQVVASQDRRQVAAIEQRATNYRRAIGACLDARGYSVQ